MLVGRWPRMHMPYICTCQCADAQTDIDIDLRGYAAPSDCKAFSSCTQTTACRHVARLQAARRESP
eukprot:scaffold313480_cov37-Tisochrysis_lutea.AAC.3